MPVLRDHGDNFIEHVPGGGTAGTPAADVRRMPDDTYYFDEEEIGQTRHLVQRWADLEREALGRLFE